MDWIVLPRPISSAKMQFRLRAEKKEKKKSANAPVRIQFFMQRLQFMTSLHLNDIKNALQSMYV